MIRKIGIFLFLLILFATRGAFLARAQTSGQLLFSPQTQSVDVGQELSVDILVNTAGEDVNTVSAHFSYDADLLELVNVDTSNSEFPNFVENNTQIIGTVKLTGYVVPNYNGIDGLFARVNFKSKAEGSAILSFVDTSGVYRDDGLGTNILDYDSLEQGVITIGSSGAATATATPTSGIGGPTDTGATLTPEPTGEALPETGKISTTIWLGLSGLLFLVIGVWQVVF